MEKRALLGIGILAALGAVLYASRSAYAAYGNEPAALALWPASTEPAGDGSPEYPAWAWDAPGTIVEPWEGDPAMTDTRTPDEPGARVLALAALIRQFEAAGDYQVIYGGRRFTDFSRHPNVRVPFHNPRKAGAGNNDFSTAAGAYQINFPTYSEFSVKLGLYDFSPATQDAIAIALLKSSGAYNAAMQGDMARAINLASGRWASLPGSTAGQGPRSMSEALAFLDSYTGAA